MKLSVQLLRKIVAACRTRGPKSRSVFDTIDATIIDGGTVFRSDDGETSTSYTVGAGYGNGLSGSVSMSYLRTALTGLTGDIELTGEPTNGWAVEASGGTVNIPAAPIWAHESIEDEDGERSGLTYTLSSAALEYALAACSTDRARPVLGSVLFTGLELVGTDSYRLHRAPALGTYPAEHPPVLLPIEPLQRALAVAKAKKLAHLTVIIPEDGSRAGCGILAGGVAAFTVRAPGSGADSYPTYGQLFPAVCDTVTVNRSDLARALKLAPPSAVMILGRGDDARLSVHYRHLDSTDPSNIGVGPGLLAVTGLDVVSGGDGDVWRRCGPSVISLNPVYLADAIAAVDFGGGSASVRRDELVTLGVTTALRPLVVGDSSGPVALIMPTRLSDPVAR